MATKSEVLKLLNQIKPYTGATRIGESTKKNRAPEKAFLKAFNTYVDKEFFGNKSAALRALGINREKFRGIETRTLGGTDRRIGNIGKGSVMQTTTRTPKNVKPLTEITTDLKSNKNLLKKLVSKTNKNKFYTPKDIGNIIGADVSDKRKLDTLVSDLKRFNVDTVEKAKNQKLYKFGDAMNKITKGYFGTKLVKGDRKAATERAKIISKIDKPLNEFIGAHYGKLRNLSKDLDIFQPNAVEDVGHAMSIKITDKYPKLFKNSNINKLSTLVFQDPEINRKILEATGYESNHEKLFKELNKLVGKEVTPQSQKEILKIKEEMNKLYNKAIFDISKTSKSGTTLYNPRNKKYTTLQSPYFKGQENRLPKIDLKIPAIGETFKSENIFADMSKVDEAYRVGQAHKINPNAKVLNDLSDVEQNLFKENFINQSRNNIEKFYTKAGYPASDIKDLSEAIDIGTDSRAAIIAVEAYDKASPAAKIKMENRIGCKRGCFIKTVKEKPEKLIRLFRGERANAPGTMAKYIPGTSQVEQVPYSDKLKGRFFTTNLDVAKSFADNKSKIKSIDIPEKDFNIGTKMARRINVDQMADQTILPKKIMKQIDSGTLKYNSELGAFENLKTQTVAPQAEIKQYAVDNPMEVKVGEPAKLPKANKSVLKTVGKTLAAVGAPLPTALLDTYFINEQVKQGKTTDEIVSNPLNWLGLATMSPLSRAAGIDKAGKVNTALRLGLNPGTIRGISRFVGLPGLALSTAMTAYDQYTKYKNQEGFIYKLFNKEES